jgi:uncharacterized RDD family membrane protein YckC
LLHRHAVVTNLQPDTLGRMPPGPPDDEFPRTPPLPPPPFPPVGPTGGRGPGQDDLDALGRPLASWGQRLVALVIDELFIYIVTFCAVYALGVRKSFAGAMVSLVMAAVYYAVLNGSEMGQTFGKRAMGIQVRDAGGSGGSIGMQRAGLRFVTVGLFRIVPFFGLFTLLDGLWPLWDRQRQALHDKIAGTVVVRVTPS